MQKKVRFWGLDVDAETIAVAIASRMEKYADLVLSPTAPSRYAG